MSSIISESVFYPYLLWNDVMARCPLYGWYRVVQSTMTRWRHATSRQDIYFYDKYLIKLIWGRTWVVIIQMTSIYWISKRTSKSKIQAAGKFSLSGAICNIFTFSKLYVLITSLKLLVVCVGYSFYNSIFHEFLTIT